MNTSFRQLLLLICVCFLYFSTTGQTIVKGYVQIENGEVIPGINVLEKGTFNGTTTDETGYYELKVANKKAVLEYSLVGYQTLEKSVRNGTTIYVELQAKSTTLQKVVVTALGIEKVPEPLAYSTTVLKGEKLVKAQEINLGNALSGRIAGVNVNQLATGPGGSSRVVIRGNSSISGSNQPLFVIDGLPMGTENLGSPNEFGGSDFGDGLLSINPDDIEKITILKGMSAAALYGSRAANGAVLITTKKGRKKKGIGVEFNTNVTIDVPILRWDFQEEYGQGWTADTLPTSLADALRTNWGSYGLKLNEESSLQFDNIYRPYENAGNNYRDFFQKGRSLNNTLTLLGGSEQFNIRWSLSDLRSDGVMLNNTFERQSVSVNSTGKFSPKLTAEISARYVVEKSKNRPRVSNVAGNALYSLAILPVNTPLSSVKGPNGNGSMANGEELRITDYDYLTNPYWAIHRFKNEDRKDRLIGVFSLNYDLTKNLWIKGRIGTDNFTVDRSELTPYGTLYANRGILYTQTYFFRETNMDLLIGFEKKYDFGIGLKINGGGTRMKNEGEVEWVYGESFNVPFVEIPNNLQQRFPGIYASKRAINSLYGSMEISAEDWLFFTLTARNDWYSTLNPKNNNLFFPSLGISWIFTKNWQMPKWLNFGKFRATGASVGNDIPPYSLFLGYTFQGSHLNQPLGTIANSTLPNEGLSPGLSTEVEAGLELKMLDYRVSVDFSIYQSQTIKENTVNQLSVTSGFNRAFFSNGKIRNRGVELTINATPIRTPDFSWNTSINIAKNENKVLSLGANTESIQLFSILHISENVSLHHQTGYPSSVIKGFEYKRDAEGNIVHDEQGVPLAGDFTVLGDSNQDVTGGFYNQVMFKNIVLGFLIDYKFGGQIFSASNAIFYGHGKHKATLNGREDGIVGEGVTETGEPNEVLIPASELSQYHFNISKRITEAFVYDADFVKLREVTLGYTFSRKNFSKLPVEKLTFSLVGRNLLLLHTKIPNIDPESSFLNGNAQGIELFGLPTTRSFGANVNVKF